MTGRYRPLDLDAVRLRPIGERAHKVRLEDFGRTPSAGASFAEFIDALPHILKGNDLREVVEGLARSVERGKPVVFGLGAHVIKCGLSSLIIDLIDRGVISAVALNGGGAIHDFELAMFGATSEDVEANLAGGQYGMIAETAQGFHAALAAPDGEGGLGWALGRALTRAAAPYGHLSILQRGYDAGVPVTVHVAIGTDTVHMLPGVDAGRIGALSHRDFRLLAAVIAEMRGGGAYVNAGSAVVLPEVFLKCVALCRNLGHDIGGFTTLDLDMVRHYRPMTNVVARHTTLGARGYAITGHHELLLPLIAFALVERLEADAASAPMDRSHAHV
ncbi:MAG: hypothetical protein WEE64_08070 [Dehalococcoidia bacterium]